MSREKRLKEYADPMRPENWCGASTKEYIGRWSDRAHEESDSYKHRAKSNMELPDTFSRQGPDPHTGRSGDQRAQAKADKNTAGQSDYMRGLKREA
jgi:hypothetical protein